ncbi:MAG TPA: SRPBCC family protein [Terriglobales bacterium]|nr:SRPBCC family protein [Terriglobales bacterium]
MTSVQEMSKIENQVVIHASRSRVWRALTTPSEFSAWFCAKLSVAEFSPGGKVDLVSTYPGHEGTKFGFEVVEKIPESRFVWRWKPSEESEPYTLVTFELHEIKDGTLVKVTESGFDRISLARRAKSFESNMQGWQIQMRNIREYVENH